MHRFELLYASSYFNRCGFDQLPFSATLKRIIDNVNVPDTKLGDFRTSLLHTQTKTPTTIDFTYDNNGNMVKDYNKDILTYSGANGITYNFLDLPQTVTFKEDGSTNKGTIIYTYKD